MAFPQKKAPSEFTNPTDLPANEEVSKVWQQANKDFWETHPMLYDWNTPNNNVPQTVEYFNEIDRVFLVLLSSSIPKTKFPLMRLFLTGMCGMGGFLRVSLEKERQL